MQIKSKYINCFTGNSKCKMIPLNEKYGIGRRVEFVHVNDCPNYEEEQILILNSVNGSSAPRWEIDK